MLLVVLAAHSSCLLGTTSTTCLLGTTRLGTNKNIERHEKKDSGFKLICYFLRCCCIILHYISVNGITRRGEMLLEYAIIFFALCVLVFVAYHNAPYLQQCMKIAISADIYMFKVRKFNLFSNNKFSLFSNFLI